MIRAVAEQHQIEVDEGQRFKFGKNWAKFLRTVNAEKMAMAEQSLQTALSSARLDGKTFLDIGSGSGLFSLAARHLGATVHSFDYDSASVWCTEELKRRFFPNDPGWTVDQGSILDPIYVAQLGTFDVVYSWGVLHHTGQMWAALDSVKSLVKHGGQLYVAIYNDLGAVTDHWRSIKRTYNRLPSSLRLPFALSIIGAIESRSVFYHLRHRKLSQYIHQWTHYDSLRGMSKWYDLIDWIGGYPYECATMEDLIDLFSKDGFALEWSLSRGMGTGCNELVFRRKSDLGVFIDNLVPKSRFLLRRCGRRVAGPFQATSNGHIARIPDALRQMTAPSLVLFRDGKLAGPAISDGEAGTLLIAPPDWPAHKVAATKFEVAPGKVQRLERPFQAHSGHMFGTPLVDLKYLADDTTPSHDTSPVYGFENAEQLVFPHALHVDIVKFGSGRFSHWGQDLLFSSSDNSDPRSNGRVYEIMIVQSDDEGSGRP
jgi:2-polyprenyl-3-methyl-5-hydroxy-6-metoxy-1,4-benzoquinol methylase